MFNFKKILSFILILIFAFNLISTSSIAYELKFYDDCSKINDDNLECCYSDCANVNTKDILNAGKSFVFIKSNFPKNDFYISFNDLDEIFEKLKIESTEELIETSCEKNSYFSKLNSTLKIGFSGLLGAVGGFLISCLNIPRKHRRNFQMRSSSSSMDSSRASKTIAKSSFINALSLLGAIVGGGISSLYLVIKENQKQKKCQKGYQKYSDVYNLNKGKKLALNLLLKELEKSNYYSDGADKDSYLIVVSHYFNEPKTEFKISSCKLGLNFTAEGKAVLPKKLKDFAKKIRQNLEENEMLSEYNKEQARN